MRCCCKEEKVIFRCGSIKMKHKLKRLMAYIYMPLIFIIAGYGLLYLAVAPYIDSIVNIGSAVMVQETPTFHTRLGSIYDEPPIAVDEQPATVKAESVTWPKYGEQYAKLDCDALELHAPVYFGDNKEILREGAGQYIGSFLPGYDRLILLAGHNTTYFKPLINVKEGDIFTVTTTYGIYQYEVTGTRIADHNDSTAYDLLQEEEELVLYTCYPFEALAGTKTDRLFVYTKKIAGPRVVD